MTTTQRKRAVREFEYHPMIRDLPAGERPRERLRDRGATALSNVELLAILLRTGTVAENVLGLATRLLSQHHGLDGLARAGFQELAGEYGVGEAKAAQLQAAIDLGKRLSAAPGPQRASVRSPQDVADLLMAEMALLDQEHFRVVVLNTKNEVMATPTVFVGSVNATTVSTAEGVPRGGASELPGGDRGAQPPVGRSHAQRRGRGCDAGAGDRRQGTGH